jgi:uncharacterized membrane protein
VIKLKTKNLVVGGLIAALYAVLTYISAAMGLAYGPVQFRLGEILTVLPIFSPSAVYGLTLGCIISNIGSSLGPVDMIFGTAATLLAAVLMRALRKKLPLPLLLLFPAICNAIIIGAELWCFAGDVGFFYAAATVGLGELAVVYIGGLPLCSFLKKNNIF